MSGNCPTARVAQAIKFPLQHMIMVAISFNLKIKQHYINETKFMFLYFHSSRVKLINTNLILFVIFYFIL